MRSKIFQKQWQYRFFVVVWIVFALAHPVMAKENGKVEKGGYWRDSETFVREYSIPGIYKGDNCYQDMRGNYFQYPTKRCKKGKSCILYLSDNGTAEVEDDIIIGVE